MKNLIALAAAGAVLASSFASTSHYADGTKLAAKNDSWQSWTQEWKTVSADFTKVSVEVGSDETELNFAWLTKKVPNPTPVVYFGKNKNKLVKYSGSFSAVDKNLTGGEEYLSNKVTVSGLAKNTNYFYCVEKNGVRSEIKTIRTGDPKDFKILYVGDPQIGASKGQKQNGEKLAATSGEANTAARNDAYGWNRTLEIASEQNKDIDFIISAGDQVNKTSKPKEEEFAGFLNAEFLSHVPLATTIGNHDSLNTDYAAHFNVPNPTSNGTTVAGGDYFYKYGSALFIVLNTNNYNVAEHELTMKEAVDYAPDAKWRIVTIHQDIYGSGLDHSDTDGMILRTQLTPVFDKYDVDVVLQGHDHTYSRTKLLYGDGKTHGKYEFRLNDDGSDYDWDHAFNVDLNEKIALSAKSDEEKTALDGFQKDNRCYTIEDVAGNSVTNPKGTLYMTANSASGSKYYELISAQQDYIAVRSQNWLPSYSIIEITPEKFAIDTYQITDDGKVEKIDETFTIVKK